MSTARRLACKAFLVLTACLVVAPSCRRQPPQAPPTGAEVHGYVYADLRERRVRKTDKVYLPDITAFLREATTGAESARVKTDLKGFFMIPKQPPGQYQLCLEAPGYVSACPQTLSVVSDMVFLEPASIVPQGGVLLGGVILADGRPCTFDDPLFGLRFDTAVRAVNTAGVEVAPAVRANYVGEYVIPAIPTGPLSVRAACQAATAQQSFTAAMVNQIDLILSNSTPTNIRLVATVGGQAVRRVAPGTTVTVAISASDVDPLHYRWSVSAAQGAFTSLDAGKVTWTLPDFRGLHTIYVLVHDTRGGTAFGRLAISTTDAEAFFSGTVAATDAPAVEGATVDVNGRTTQTSPQGGFALVVPESNRYVLTITKPGYQLLSKVFDVGVMGGRYLLVRAQQFVFDAAKGSELVERGRQERPGAQVVIPPGSLTVASGSITAYVSTIDLRDPEGRFPGEYAGINSGGREVGINSLGAVDVTLADSAGKPVDLAPGRTALVKIPVDSVQLGVPGMPGTAPATVPIWFYNRKTGLWEAEGTAKLVGNVYEATVRHFSTINADVEFSNPACVRIVSDTTRLSLPYQLRVSVPAASPAKVVTKSVADALSVVVRLPQNTAIKLEVLDSAGQVIPLATKVHTTGATSSPAFPNYDYGSCTSEVTMTFAEPSNGGFLNYYGLNTPEQADAYYAKIDPVATAGSGTVSSAGTTVTGTGTAFTTFFVPGHLIRAAGQVRLIQAVTSNTTLVTESPFNPPLGASAYDKVGAKPTLTDWKTANGFNAGDDADAVYLNAGDLGLGRWMHMKRTGASNIAYYVSNYGIPPNNGSADLAAFAKQSNDPSIGLIATVAMEYTPPPPGLGLAATPYTKFYVYNAAGNRVNKADLDGNLDKYLPNLCLICHGGAPATGNADPRGDYLARFIFFDPQSFKYSNLGAAFIQKAQEGDFKDMNRRLRDDTNASASITELVNGWYGGAALPLAEQNPNYVAAGWRLIGSGTPPGTSVAEKSSAYSDVVKPSCRACHTTRDGRVSWDTWDTAALYDGFKDTGGTIRPYVCGPTRIMAHAKVTFLNFWLSTAPHRPASLGAAGVDTWTASYPCPCRDPLDNSPANASLPPCP